MKFPLVVIRNEYDGREIHININNVLHIRPKYDGGYHIMFIGGQELDIDFKTYDKLKKAFEVVAEQE